MKKFFFGFLFEITYCSALIGSTFCFVDEIEWNLWLNTSGQKNINTQNFSYVFQNFIWRFKTRVLFICKKYQF
jgi:hypothetical protein